MTKSKKEVEFEKKLGEITADLQRTRADFENFRKRVDSEKNQAKESGKVTTILSLLPIIDSIERAINYVPDELKDNQWAQGIVGLKKNLDKMLENLNMKRIDAKPGTLFNPNLHDAISMDEEAKGQHEVIAEELQSGYILNESPIRHAMVRVTRK